MWICAESTVQIRLMSRSTGATVRAPSFSREPHESVGIRGSRNHSRVVDSFSGCIDSETEKRDLAVAGSQKTLRRRREDSRCEPGNVSRTVDAVRLSNGANSTGLERNHYAIQRYEPISESNPHNVSSDLIRYVYTLCEYI